MQLNTDNRLLSLKARRRNIFSVWLKAVRFHYVPPSFLPAILCSAIAWSSHYPPDIPGFFLVLASVTINHCGLNLLDDLCDYQHAVDGKDDEKNPYTGGSGVLTERLLSTREVAFGAVACFLVTAAIGLYLTATRGWPVLAFGLFGVFCSVFYTLPPVKFGYRGLGELGLLVNFGPVIGLGAYYVQARTLAVEPFFMSLVMGAMMWSMIIINEIPDYEEDRSGGKMNLVARFGRERAILFYIVGLIAAYAILVLTVWVRIAPVTVLTGLITLPLAIRSAGILRENYLHKLRIAPANVAMIKIHFLTGAGMIGAYLVHFLEHGGPPG